MITKAVTLDIYDKESASYIRTEFPFTLGYINIDNETVSADTAKIFSDLPADVQFGNELKRLSQNYQSTKDIRSLGHIVRRDSFYPNLHVLSANGIDYDVSKAASDGGIIYELRNKNVNSKSYITFRSQCSVLVYGNSPSDNGWGFSGTWLSSCYDSSGSRHTFTPYYMKQKGVWQKFVEINPTEGLVTHYYAAFSRTSSYICVYPVSAKTVDEIERVYLISYVSYKDPDPVPSFFTDPFTAGKTSLVKNVAQVTSEGTTVQTGYGYMIYRFPDDITSVFKEILGPSPDVDPIPDPGGGGGYPYEPTPPHGGNGEQDFSSDEIPNPTTPTWSAVACGLCRAYSPTLAEVQAMAGELWSSNFVDSMKKLYNDPMEAVISFGTIPVKPNTADTTTQLVVGNYTFTSASARPVTSNFVTVDCGEVTLPKQYDGFQDYEPYTKIQIYLPFIGNQTVTPSDVVGKPAHLYYRIDVLTGACLAWLSVENRVLYQWTGNCFTEIPLSKNSKSQIYSQIIHGIVNTITSSAQGGVAAGAAGAALGGVSGIISTITDVATSKHSDVMRTGALNPASSTLGVRTPYFIISYPTMVTPEGYAAAMGIPVNAGGTIGDFSGYTVVDSVHLENISATENELREIESLLTGGVIL